MGRLPAREASAAAPLPPSLRLLALGLLAGACALSPAQPGSDAGPDAGADGGADGGSDAGADAGPGCALACVPPDACHTSTCVPSSGTCATTVIAGCVLLPSIGYPPGSFQFTAGAAIPIVTPVNSGGPAQSWAIAPPPPPGLWMSSSTGQLSGTPAAASSSTTYTVTAVNGAGSATTTLSIAVAPQPLSYSTIYESGLAPPWRLGNWNGVTTTLAAAVPSGHAGTAAIENLIGGSGAVGLTQPFDATANPPLLNEARTVEFDLYLAPSSTPPDALQFLLNDLGQSDSPSLTSLIPGWSGLPNDQRYGHWFHVAVDLASIHPLRPDIFRILLFNSSAVGGIHLFLASVRIGYRDRTTPPVVALDSAALDPRYTALTLAFRADEPVLYRVEYGVGAYDHTRAGPDVYAASGTAVLSGLAPGATVQYRIVATDHRIDPLAAPNQAALASTFAVPAAPTSPPVLSALRVSGVTGNGALLGISTDRPCTGAISVQRPAGPLLTRRWTDLATSATATLDLLEPSQRYVVSVSATDAFGLSATGSVGFQTLAAATATVVITIDPANSRPISPYIYGTNQNLGAPQYTFGRMGGNAWTAYNWTNNGTNAGSDWSFWNDDFLPSYYGVPIDQYPVPGIPITTGLDQIFGTAGGSSTRSGAALVTVPIQGYVAADLGTDPNGDIRQSGPDYLTTRLRTLQLVKGAPFSLSPTSALPHVYTDEYVNWVMTVAKGDHPGKEIFYSLDNEPELWFSTHEATAPVRESYDSFLAKEIGAAQVIKDVDPAATIFGFVSYGWSGYTQFQGSSQCSTSSTCGDASCCPTSSAMVLDFDTYGDFTDYFLDRMQAAGTSAGRRLVDVLDLHYYTAATTPDGVGSVGSADASPAVAAERVQSTRSLWDPTYEETSWIPGTLPIEDQAIRLIPRMLAKIDAHDPGTQLAITEYDFQGGTDLSGAIAQADALGLFGAYGLFAANHWDMAWATPGGDRFIEAAFRMFRGFDGADANFGDLSLPTTSSDTSKVAAYASRDSQQPGRIVLVAINRSTSPQEVRFSGLSATGTAFVYRLDGSADPVAPAPAPVGSLPVDLASWVVNLPPYSISTVEIR